MTKGNLWQCICFFVKLWKRNMVLSNSQNSLMVRTESPFLPITQISTFGAFMGKISNTNVSSTNSEER